MPYLIHKYLYKGLIDEARQAQVELCIRCGLCSFVCPSKIELREQFTMIQELIEKEKEILQEESVQEHNA
jgi:Na+-translocating ferredoxin:NAD+ oxidoreductase RnfC subunit